MQTTLLRHSLLVRLLALNMRLADPRGRYEWADGPWRIVTWWRGR